MRHSQIYLPGLMFVYRIRAYACGAVATGGEPSAYEKSTPPYNCIDIAQYIAIFRFAQWRRSILTMISGLGESEPLGGTANKMK